MADYFRRQSGLVIPTRFQILEYAGREVPPDTDMRPPLLFRDALAVYLRNPWNRRGKLSPASEISYRSHWEHCHEFGREMYGRDDFLLRESDELPREYIIYRSEVKSVWDDNRFVPAQNRRLSARSVAVTHRTLRAIYNRMQKLGHLKPTENPFIMDMVPCPQGDDLLPSYLNNDQILSLARVLARTDHAERNLAFYYTLLDTGCRISEVLGAVQQDLDWNGRVLRVIGKGKEREVSVGPRAIRAIETYYTSRKLHDPRAPLFFDVSDEPLCYGGARMIMRRAYEAASIDMRRCGLHTLRHTFARNYLLNGGNLPALSQLLGHSSLNVTMIYSRFITCDLRQQHDRCSPVEQLLPDVEELL